MIKVDDIMDFEQGLMSTEQVVDFFVDLYNTRTLYRLQGTYGRTFAALVNQGLIKVIGGMASIREEEE